MRYALHSTAGLGNDVERLRAGLPEGPAPVARPVLVVVSGLPGSGKSHFSRRLVAEVPLLVLESDVLRLALFPSPSYTRDESDRLFSACHALIAGLLEQGVPVLLDATNLAESHREPLYRIAGRVEAGLILVRLHAPPEVVHRRLKARSRGLDPEDQSSADWKVYRRLSDTVEPITRNHFVVDTSRDISSALAKAVREIGRRTRTPG